MKKLLIYLTILATLALTGCVRESNAIGPASPSPAQSTPAQSTPGPTPSPTPAPTPEPPTPTPFEPGVIAEYFQPEDIYSTFIDLEGAKAESITEYIDLEGGCVQRRLLPLGRVEVLRLDEGAITLTYSKENIAFTHNFLLSKGDGETIYLKEPFAVGNSWETPLGTATITTVGERLSLPAGVFEAIEVTTELADGALIRRYFAKGVGLIQEQYGALDSSGNFKATAQYALSAVERERQHTRAIRVYFAEPGSGKTRYTEKEVPLVANANMREVFAALLKDPPSSSGLIALPPRAQIMSIRYDASQVTVDFSSKLVEYLDIGLRSEKLMLQAIANTFASYYGVKRVKITVGRQPYLSTYLLLGPNDTFSFIEGIPY